MSDMKFPRYIFAIGGAGKELVFSMLGNPVHLEGKYVVTSGKDWIIREILKPKPSPLTVDITIVDTATEDENKDLEKIKAIEENIDKISNEYSASLTDPTMGIGRIRISYELLTKKMTLTTPSSLIGIQDDIKKAKLAKIWWINDPELGDDWLDKLMRFENLRTLDFSKGVYRKRAISKAIYYKAISENLFKPNILKNDEVDIIVGLGGGTGSGIAIDLAKRLKSIQQTANITLFGILSTLNESEQEKSNNFAILSELEYNHLNGNDFLKNLFKDIVLVPIEKTEYGGKFKTTHEYEILLEEFDKTFAYIFVAYHNTGKIQNPFAGLPDYAPFIIATSQLVHYNIDAIKKFKEELIKVLKDKESSFESEETIYGIQNIIDEWYKDTTRANLFDQDEILVKERLNRFKTVLGHKTFGDLGYEGVAQLKNAVNAGEMISSIPLQNIQVSESTGSEKTAIKSGIEVQIDSIKNQVPNFPASTFKDDIDPMLYNILKKDIEMIEKRISVLKSINKVDDNIIKMALKSMLKGDQLGLGVGQREITKEINTLVKKQKDLENKTADWQQINSKDIESLNALDDLITDCIKNNTYIKTELNEFVNRLNAISKIRDIDTIEYANMVKVLDNMYKDILNKTGLEFKDKSPIIESITYLKELRRNQIEYKKKPKLIYKLTGRARSVKQKIRNEIDRLNAEINRYKVFKVKEDDTFITIYEPDIEIKIIEKKDILIENILKNTKDIFPNASPVIMSNLKNALKNSETRKTVNINEIMANVSERLRLLRAFDNKFSAMSPVLASYSANVGNYHEFIDNMEKNVEKMREEKAASIYVTEAQPKNLLQIMTKATDITDMIKNPQELTTLKMLLDDGLSRTLDNNYNVLTMLKIETPQGTKSWKNTRLMESVVSIAEIGPKNINAEKQIRDAFNPLIYSDWVTPWGDPWEVGIVLFIAGVPIDNIKNVVDAKEGFYAKYHAAEPRIFFYHSLMLEDGNLVKRKKIFHLESEEEKLLLLKDDSEVKALYAENHEIVPIKDCL